MLSSDALVRQPATDHGAQHGERSQEGYWTDVRKMRTTLTRDADVRLRGTSMRRERSAGRGPVRAGGDKAMT